MLPWQQAEQSMCCKGELILYVLTIENIKSLYYDHR